MLLNLGFLHSLSSVIYLFVFSAWHQSHPAGDRKNFSSSDLSDILPEEIEVDVKAAAEISMGTEVSEEDISNILHLCEQVHRHGQYLASYL